jgi:hypothetical protein
MEKRRVEKRMEMEGPRTDERGIIDRPGDAAVIGVIGVPASGPFEYCAAGVSTALRPYARRHADNGQTGRGDALISRGCR